MMKRFLLFFSLLILVFWSCKKDKDEEEEEYVIPDLEEYVTDNFPEAQYIEEEGFYIYITSEGTGPKPTEGEKLYTYYQGTLLTGEIFDAVIRSDIADEPKFPYTFILNSSSVIKGWNKGFSQLKKGSKAVLLIPDSLAYGNIKLGKIPPNSPLRFDVELLYVK